MDRETLDRLADQFVQKVLHRNRHNPSLAGMLLAHLRMEARLSLLHDPENMRTRALDGFGRPLRWGTTRR